MEQPHDPFCVWVHTREIRPLQQVAIGAREGQVFCLISAAMLTGDDMLDMKLQFGKPLGKVAILATSTGPGHGPSRAARAPSGSLWLLQESAGLSLQKTQNGVGAHQRLQFRAFLSGEYPFGVLACQFFVPGLDLHVGFQARQRVGQFRAQVSTKGSEQTFQAA